jgi:molybdopterin-synthase adenylyltransferase
LKFEYTTMVNRNIGFVTVEEQSTLRSSQVLVLGVGGMGGACIQSLARAGIGKLAFADFDVFEIGNLNRQAFANLSTVGMNKTEATRLGLQNINPQIELEIFGEEWVDNLWGILKNYPTVVNGTDDIRATTLLYRAARALGCTVIDSYASTLASVYTTKPGDPVPEERYKSSTVGKAPSDWEEADILSVKNGESLFVLTNSSTAKYVDLNAAAEMIQGKRSRMSFAPMVNISGNLMAYEAILSLLQKPSGAGFEGYFLNVFEGKIEKPIPKILRPAKEAVVKRFLRSLEK